MKGLITLKRSLLVLMALLSFTVQAQNIVVLQIGNGTETLSANGNSLFLKQFTPSGAAVSTVTIPNSGCTPLILGATATSEGAISRSADNSFIMIPGYVTPVGGATSLATTTSATVNRGVGRVDASGNFTLPTRTATAFSANNIRGAASDGNNNFWGSGATSGIYYFGTNSAAVTVNSGVTNTRSVQVNNGNLYFSSSSGSNVGINQVGTSGTPTTSGNTATLLISTGAGSSPYGFQFNSTGTVCYVADDRATVAGGIQKWTFNGSVWSLAYTLGTGVSNIGARGVVVDFSGANPIIYATSAEATFNRLIKITDTGSGSTATTLATAPATTIFRGISFAPVNNCASTITITPTVTNSCGSNTGSVNITVSGGTTPYSYAWSNAAGTVCQTTQNLTGVGAGSYTVKVTDALGRCYATSTSTVTQSAAPTPTITGTLGFCAGFSTTLNAGTSDASGSYTSYSWSNGQTSQTNSVNTAASHTVTVTNTNGCTGSATVSVVQFPTPSVSISGNLSFCAGGSTTLDAGAGFSSYSWSSGQSASTINVTTSGTYTVTVSNSNGCTTISTPVTVTVSAGLNPVISGTLSFCTGTNTVLSTPPGYVSYQWALNGTPINLATSNTYTATSQGTYTVAVSDGSCNGTSAGVFVTVNALPSVSISPSSPAAVCKGIPLSLTASGDPAAYAWSPSTGLNLTTGAAVSATPNNTTTYTVSATDVNGCSNTSSVTVSINQLPVVTVDFLNSVICSGSSATLTASGATSYGWAPATYLNTTTGATVTSNSPSSTITYTVTGTDGNGCINTATSNVVVVPASPAPTVTNPSNLCLNSSASALTATPNPASASLLWYTSATGGIGSTSAPIPNTSTPGITNYYVSQVPGSDVKIAINGFVDNRTPDLFSVLALSAIPAGTVIYFTDNGWTGTTFRGFPTTGLAGSEGLCKLVANNLIPAGTNIVSYSTSANYSWVTSGLIGAATGTANSFSQLSFSQTGDQIYAFMSNVPASPIGNIARHLFVFDITNGFESAISTNDGGVPPGLSQLDGTAITFQGFTTIIPPALTGQGTYYSLINDGQYRTSDQWYSYLKTESNYTKLAADITTGLPSTSFNVATACESPRSLITVTVNDAPFPDASSGGTICPGGDITLFSDPNFLFSSYSWTGPLLFTSTDQNPTITLAGITNGGNYVVTVFDGDGCTGSQTVNVTVSNSTVTGVITNTNCSGGNNGAIDITPTGGIAPYTFNWSNGATTEDISGLGVGNYTVTVTDAIACIGTPTTFTIGSQNAASTFTVSATPTSVCLGSSSTLNVIDGASGATYAWSPTGTLNTNTGTSVIATPLVNTTYQVVATELSGCTSSASVTVSLFTSPTVSISPSSATICNGGSISLTGSGASTYSWSPSLTLSATTGNPVTATPTSQTTYSVIGTDINGCTASSSSIISITAIVNPTSVTAASTGFTGSVNVTWVNPTSCFDEVLILASTAANTGIPVGDGTAYTSSLTYGTGTNLGNGYIVYKGITSPQIVTGLSNGTQYFFKIFTRKGSVWSVGTTDVTATPNIAPTLTEVILPKFMEGNTSTNATRIPCAYYLTLSGLNANATYRYINQVVNAADLATASGAGNCISVSTSGSFVSTGSPSLSTGPFGTFVTNGTGTYSGWFITEPTGNARFTPGADVNFRVRLNDGAGGITAVTFLTTTSGVRVLSPGAATTQGTALRGASFATAKNFAVLYDNISGTGRPLSASFIESDGSTNSASYAAFYASVDGVAGSYGVIIPNNNSNGVRRIEQRTLIGANLLGCAATDADGIWPSGANTVNPTLGAPTTGTTSIIITNTDAPLFVAPITGSSSVCVGSTITLSDATVGGVWSSGSPLFASINLTGVVSALAAGTTVINYTLPSGCSSSLSVTVNPNPTLTATPTQILCNGGTGSVSLSSSGGTTPYTYGGSATTGLTAGTYNYTVTDANSCSASASATINAAPTAIAISQLTNTPAGCSNTATGALAVSVAGGTPGYTYLWNNGSVTSSISSLLPGNFTVIVTDANGCTAQSTFTVGFTTTAILYYADLDNDTYGSNLDAGTLYCVAPPLTSLNNTDCNDAVFAINPGVSEVCGNGIDDNCNTLIDELCPTNVTLNLTMFIQGFYLSGNTMTPALVNTGVSTDPLMSEVDTVVVELHDALSPFNFVESDAQVLKVDGTIQLHFSAAILGGSYYIVVKHRNSMETWSKNPVTFSSITTFDFAH